MELYFFLFFIDWQSHFIYTKNMKTVKTIYDIAKEAGVSASTVSRIVNNKPGINSATREKVQKLLQKYNYIPNEAARGLVKQSSKIIGILIEDIRIAHHTESVYIIEQEMTKLGYTCITLSTGAKKPEYIKLLEQRRIEGAVLVGSMFGTNEVKKSIQKHLSNIPVVMLNGELNLPNVYSILVDEKQGIKEITKYFIKQGRKNLAFISDGETPSNKNKIEGFIEAMEEEGIEKENILIYKAYKKESYHGNPEQIITQGQEITKKILKKNPDTNGYIYSIDLLAIGGLTELKNHNISIPKKAALIGVDNSLYGKICTPKLSTLDNKLTEISMQASKILFDIIEKKETAHKIILRTEIIHRETT